MARCGAKKQKKVKRNAYFTETIQMMRKFSAKLPFSNNKLQTGSTKLTNDNTEKNLINLACRWLERDGVQLILSKLCGVEKISRRCWLSVFMTS